MYGMIYADSYMKTKNNEVKKTRCARWSGMLHQHLGNGSKSNNLAEYSCGGQGSMIHQHVPLHLSGYDTMTRGR